MKLLIKHNANINSKDNGKDTPMLGAAYEGNIEVVKILIANKAKINIKNRTPVDIAFLWNKKDILQLFKTTGKLSDIDSFNEAQKKTILFSDETGSKYIKMGIGQTIVIK